MDVEEDDPFDVFGGGDSDDEDTAAAGEKEQQTVTKLVEAANARIAAAADTDDHSSTCDATPTSAASAVHDSSSSADEDGTCKWTPLSPLWPDRPPLYLGPMAAVSETAMGGGRGYIATRFLPPGTLLLVEKPIFHWPEEQIGRELGLISILYIARHPNAQQITRDMELLHPTLEATDAIGTKNNEQAHNVEQIDSMMKEMAIKYEGDALMEQILGEYRRREISRSDGRQLTEEDVYRMLLALRYNGFGTGVYVHFAIFNHAEKPNCIKFAPEDKAQSMSEIRTTRAVKRGEALSLSYLDPREASHATRRQHLYDQHRFDIGESVNDASMLSFELVAGELPTSSKDNRADDTTFRIEKVISEFEEQMGEIRIAFSVGGYTPEQVERAKAMEVATVELTSAAIQQLDNENHLLMIRCYRLHLDAAESLLSAATIGHVDLSATQRNNLLCRFVESARNLLALQMRYLGDSHIDLGRTYQDLSQGINTLLSHSPKALFDLNLEGMHNFAACSKEEARCEREYHRIRNLYPRNTVELIESVNKL